MSLLVQKYGGSSLATIDHVARVADQIAETYRDGHDVVAVVSAMGETTDNLMERAQKLSEAPSRRELDMLLSVGERISMALLSIAIQDRGLESVSLTGSQCGIITSQNHSNAQIMDVRPYRVQDELAKKRIVIVAGYQGTSYQREVTTLGRGGSDTTAVALAGALGAEACEIYSDVEGIFTADPSVVLDAEQMLELSHTEILEMAKGGAEVIHEEAIRFARKADIALYAKKSHDASSEGTIVRPDGYIEEAKKQEESSPGKAVTTIDNGLLIETTRPEPGFIDKLDNFKVVFQEWGESKLSVFIDLANSVGSLEELTGDYTETAVSAVSVIGQNIGTSISWTKRAKQTIRQNHIDPELFQSETDRLTWLVDPEKTKTAAEAMHGLFIEEDAQ